MPDSRPNDPRRFDAIVIGSGGGTKLAIPAAEAGLHVALIEDAAFGGTCLNRGCIPSKMLIYPAEVAELARHAAALGIAGLAAPRPDFSAIVQRIAASVDAISAANRAAHANHPRLTLLEGHARFTGPRTLAINGATLTAEKIFLAPGSRPRLPDIPGLANTPFMTSTEALRNTRLPRRLLVLGAGYIAAELGFAYGALGSQVHLIARTSLLRHADAEIATEFARVFAHRHTLHMHTRGEHIAHRDNAFTLNLLRADGARATLTGDALLVATGVVPNTDDLGLDHAGIARTPDGHIVVDDHLRTTAPGVYALGDAIGRHLFRHTVNYEGEYLMRTAVLGRDTRPLDYGPVPHAVFAHPQIAGVGETEAQLRARGADFIAGRARYADSTPGEARLLDHGLVKILVDRTSDRLLGAHIVGDEASNMIHLFIALMKKQGTLADLLDMIFIHPALPEVARNAARDAQRSR